MDGINSHNRIEPTTSVKEGSVGKQAGGNSTFTRNSSAATANNRPVSNRNLSDLDLSFFLETKAESVEQKLLEFLKNEQLIELKKSALIKQQSLKSLSMLFNEARRNPKAADNQSKAPSASSTEQAKVYIESKSEFFPKLAAFLNSEKSKTIGGIKRENSEQYYSGREKYLIDLKEAKQTIKDNVSRQDFRGIETAVFIVSILIILGVLILLLS